MTPSQISQSSSQLTSEQESHVDVVCTLLALRSRSCAAAAIEELLNEFITVVSLCESFLGEPLQGLHEIEKVAKARLIPHIAHFERPALPLYVALPELRLTEREVDETRT